MHNPPAPVLGDSHVRLTTVHQPSSVEEGDSQRGDDEERQEVAILILALESGDQCADHEEEPQHEAHQQQDLPQTAKLHVFVALMAEPEVLDEAELLHDPEPLTDE